MYFDEVRVSFFLRFFFITNASFGIFIFCYDEWNFLREVLLLALFHFNYSAFI